MPEKIQDRKQAKDTNPVPGYKLKLMVSPGIEPGPPRQVGSQGLYQPRHGVGQYKIFTHKFPKHDNEQP